jgi:hypothetical protein
MSARPGGQAALFHPEKEQQGRSLKDLHQGTAKGQVDQVRPCYLQFDYAPFRNSSIRRPVC